MAVGIYFGGEIKKPNNDENEIMISSLQKLEDDGILKVINATESIKGHSTGPNRCPTNYWRTVGVYEPETKYIDNNLRSVLSGLSKYSRRYFTLVIDNIEIEAYYSWHQINDRAPWKYARLWLDISNGDLPEVFRDALPYDRSASYSDATYKPHCCL